MDAVKLKDAAVALLQIVAEEDSGYNSRAAFQCRRVLKEAPVRRRSDLRLNSFDQLEFAALQGCDLCQLILECFKGAVEGEIPTRCDWPREWTPDSPPGMATMYSKAKKLPKSNVRLCIDVTNKYPAMSLKEVQLFDAIRVQVGPTSEELFTGQDTDSNSEEDMEETEGRPRNSSKTSESLPFHLKPYLASLMLLLTNSKGKVHPDVDGYLIGCLQVDRDLGSISNLALVKNWLDECVRNHSDCWPDEVPITPNRLLDVRPQNGIQDNIRLVELDGDTRAKLRVFSDSDDTLITLSRLDEPSDENLKSLSEDGPLASRGWTLQESILSSISISYGLHGVYWECSSNFKAANGLPNQGKAYPWKPKLLKAILHPYASGSTSEDTLPEGSIDSECRLDLIEEYHHLVEAYSRRNLTQPSDKLPAMSALARTFGDVLGNDTKYLAGLWSMNILYGLMWETWGARVPHVSKYRAPSWSWAITDKPVYWGIDYKRKIWGDSTWELEVLEHHVRLESDDYPFGEVKAGYLIVKGLVIPILRNRQVIIAKSVFNDRMGHGTYDEPSSTSEVYNWQQMILEVDHGDGTQWTTFNEDLEADSDELHIDEELYHSDECKILIICAQDDTDKRTKHITGLFIRKLPDSDSYERIGYLNHATTGYEKYEALQRRTLMLV
ncbi:hypothetical protein FSARC_13979 [Fusarium sarcochroum]|uniref:Heterokaryon incompatibility domain-containing protein n=1 Tax=Fusarium sarcochroum TaxID=1208366 RepID=A0A8H4WQR3_9HYPO|nr:hypothetical protein FSARC_13979 [Fusarium sarcochroum]